MKQARKLVPLAALAAALFCAPSASAAVQTWSGEVPTGTIGPYEVKQDLKFPVPTPPGGGYITKMETDIVDAATGDPVPISRLMLHHIVFASIGKPDSTCHGQGFLGFDSRPDPYAGFPVQRFYAAGEERAKLSLPRGYGYEIGASPFWGMTYMVMNHRERARQRGHQVHGHLRGRPGRPGPDGGDALVARRQGLPRRPDLQRPGREEEVEEEQGQEGQGQRRPPPPPPTP